MRADIRHTIVLGLGTGVTAALALAYTVYTGRILGPGPMSHFVGAVSLIAWFQVALGPINATVARFASAYAIAGGLGQVRTLHHEVLRRVTLYGLPLMLLALVLSPVIGSLLRFATVWPVVLALVTVYLTLTLSVSRGALRGLQRFGGLNTNVIIEASVRLAVGVVILKFSPTVEAALSASLIALLATITLAHWQTSACWSHHSAQPIAGAQVRKFALPMFVLMFTAAGYQNIDMLFVKRFLPAQTAGEYGAAFILARAISVAVTPVAIVLLPMLATLYEQGASIVAPLTRFCAYFLLLAALPVAAFALWPGQIVSLYGSAFTEAGVFLVPVALLRVVGFLTQLVALGGAASNRFVFLYPYVLGLLVTFVSLCVYHNSGVQIVWMSLLIQTLALVTVIPFVCRASRPKPKSYP